ncbi:uncharacterized protein EV420DRAFT_1643479 [Desarmillaria tabescens]|uniref:Uncharacterized protein n=1 Tax=Armillaria tabescens TaxID=1929756 RepID=A0AA39KB72_ARMTA|nr:uncharacterized protein EV420DRAFT_1643479 [Desarmillaria tabescens]KAK0457628.1 hypothetical protein EV420DRAFT_1643479 [Desarmillaria tabescens]
MLTINPPGVHLHKVKLYAPTIESEILNAPSCQSCVGLGEIGLDYHIMLLPPNFQQWIFTAATIVIDHGILIAVHTQEADENIQNYDGRIKQQIIKNWRIH